MVNIPFFLKNKVLQRLSGDRGFVLDDDPYTHILALARTHPLARTKQSGTSWDPQEVGEWESPCTHDQTSDVD